MGRVHVDAERGRSESFVDGYLVESSVGIRGQLWVPSQAFT